MTKWEKQYEFLTSRYKPYKKLGFPSTCMFLYVVWKFPERNKSGVNGCKNGFNYRTVMLIWSIF
jgi:hypothetical protein